MGVVTINHTHSQNLSSNPVLNDTRIVSVSQLNEIQSSGVYHVLISCEVSCKISNFPHSSHSCGTGEAYTSPRLGIAAFLRSEGKLALFQHVRLCRQ